MSDIEASNPFAPPRAIVDDSFEPAAELTDATRGARLRAAFVDMAPFFLIGVIAAVAMPLFARNGKAQAGLGALAIGVVFALAFVAYTVYSAILVYRYGQSFGKRMVGIRVVRTDGSRVAFGRFFLLRWLPIGALGAIPTLGSLVSLADSLAIFGNKRRCLHDYIADTRVVTAASAPHATLAGASGAHLRTISF